MSAGKMGQRKPVVAGQFYPADRQSCISLIEQYTDGDLPFDDLSGRILAGIVPHAGWVFSGRTAGMVFAAVRRICPDVDTFVIFGAAHTCCCAEPAVYLDGDWVTPLGSIAVDKELGRTVAEASMAVADCSAHAGEHSIEVQVPFIRHLFPRASILPIVVGPGNRAIDLGGFIGDRACSADKTIVCIGSTDLTHYGPGYGFMPMGSGSRGLEWARRVNDAEFIDLAIRLDARGMLQSAAEHSNACGAGAAAAAVASAAGQGCAGGILLEHTTSEQVMRAMGRSAGDSVGYAGIIFAAD